MILRREDVAAAPPNVGTQFDEGFDQHGGLDGHVQGSRDAGSFQRFLRAVFPADSHQSGHLLFGDFDLFASPIGHVDIGDFVGKVPVN